eukprot:2469112-Alexandrium_andersonii.AAC.1
MRARARQRSDGCSWLGAAFPLTSLFRFALTGWWHLCTRQTVSYRRFGKADGAIARGPQSRPAGPRPGFRQPVPMRRGSLEG